MDGFEACKGLQDIMLSKETYDLLVLEKNAELPYRRNIKPIEYGKPIQVDKDQIVIKKNGHMLGSVQTQVILSDGTHLGYSGDFQWPIEDVIQVNALVVDSTNGSPQKKRKYTQEEANNRLIELISEKLKHGSIALIAHRGTLQRALDLLDREKINVPVIGTGKTCLEAKIYQKYGYSIPEIQNIDSVEGEKILSNGRYIRILGIKDHPESLSEGTKIILSAYMSDPNNPVLDYDNCSFRVALSDHADFEGTLSYIKATGANFVITDNSRGGHAVELAHEIRARLGIEAKPSSNIISREWGR
jgi:Cft2 family RNA processing exonuclease